VKIYSEFFSSDIIMASPLALKLLLDLGTGPSSSGGHKNAGTSPALDFLSSVEIVVLHRADVMQMQNWSHVMDVLAACHALPRDNHDTDFSRVRPYMLEGHCRAHCQILLTTKINSPYLQSLFRSYTESSCGPGGRFSGALKLVRNHSIASSGEGGVLGMVRPKIKQVFQRVLGLEITDDLLTQETKRFEYFKSYILDPLLKLKKKRTLIVTSNYLSYTMVRNELVEREVR